jgi:hypothetical protein
MTFQTYTNLNFSINVNREKDGFLAVEVVNIGTTDVERQNVIDALNEALRMVDIRNMEYKNEHQ